MKKKEFVFEEDNSSPACLYVVNDDESRRLASLDDVREICICAATRYKDKIWRGQRHCHCISAMHDQLSYEMSRKDIIGISDQVVQGFITSRNRFVIRSEGLFLQEEAGIKSVRGNYQKQLYSEDLY